MQDGLSWTIVCFTIKESLQLHDFNILKVDTKSIDNSVLQNIVYQEIFNNMWYIERGYSHTIDAKVG